jgi:hypothetical protein
MKNLFWGVVAIVLVFTSCGPTIYNTHDAFDRAAKHRKIAILPPKITIQVKKNFSAEEMQKQQDAESLNFQNEIYKSLLNQKMKGQLFVDIMDVEETNTLLQRTFPDGTYTAAEVCKALGVDAVINSQFGLSKPMSEGAAIATVILLGTAPATNEVTVNMSIKDCSDNTMFWNYDHRYSGSLTTSVNSLVELLMRSASKKIPYNSKAN